MSRRLSISHSINRHGKLIQHQNGMNVPERPRVMQGFNSWIGYIFMMVNFRK